MDLAHSFMAQGEPFAILIQNHNDWDQPLPERLQKETNFIIKIDDQTLEDSYMVEDGIYVVTDFDGATYEKQFSMCDVAAIYDIDMRVPIMVKGFVEYPERTPKRKYGEPSEEDVQRSMECFAKHNPDLFEEKK